MEKDHNFDGSDATSVITHINTRGRAVNGYFQFDMRVQPGAQTLYVTYNGADRNRDIRILIDGQPFVSEKLEGAPTSALQVKTYALPEALTKGKTSVRVRFDVPDNKWQWATVYECRILKA